MSATRADRLLALLDERELDALLVTNLVNVRYLTGFTGSHAVAIVGPHAHRGFVTDFRYMTQATHEVAGFDHTIGETDLLAEIATLVGEGDVQLGFEDQHLPVRTRVRLRDLLPVSVELVPAGGLVEELRLVKDAEEIARVRAAAELADAALATTLADGLVGRTERAVALALEQEMRRLGARRPSFDSIVAHGAHGALPHATPRDVEIAAGSLVTIDWGAELDGYCSDCTRTYAAGAEPSAQAREVYALVASAQEAGLAAVAPGVSGQEADAVARAIVEAAGHGEHFGHGLGHGVGLEVHEAPRLSQASTSTLAAGQVVTVEPGVYVPHALGVRIEDLVLVTEHGCEPFSGLSKALTVVA